jgi:type I restriction enzyme S subunit
MEMVLVGSNYPAINSKDVKGLQIPAPCVDEQRVIAALLSDMDAEIAAVEEKLAKARAVRQGMMQVLLTGEVRLA